MARHRNSNDVIRREISDEQLMDIAGGALQHAAPPAVDNPERWAELCTPYERFRRFEAYRRAGQLYRRFRTNQTADMIGL